MLALSVRPQWGDAIVRLGKRHENRGEWTEAQIKGALRHVGKRHAIHVGKGSRRDYEASRAWIEGSGLGAVRPWGELTKGALVATFTLSAIVWTCDGGHRYAVTIDDGVVAYGDICLGCGGREHHNLPITCSKRNRWAVSGFGFILADVAPLAAPIPFSGALGFFDIGSTIVL